MSQISIIKTIAQAQTKSVDQIIWLLFVNGYNNEIHASDVYSLRPNHVFYFSKLKNDFNDFVFLIVALLPAVFSKEVD